MSKNCSEREFIFSLFLKENTSVLEKELNLKLAGVELEPKFAGLKIDMYGIEQDLGVEVFVENLLLKSDYSHQYRLLKLIEAIDKGVIIYQAVAFKEKYVKQLRDKIMDSGKDINLYFVTINPDLFQGIDLLNSGTHKLKVFENLHILSEISNPIQLLKDISIINPIHGNKEYREKDSWDFTKREDVNNYLLKQLKEKIPYFLSFQRQKSNLDSLRIIPCGFGKSGVSLMITVEDMRYRAFVELRFTEDSPPIYYRIKESEEKARKVIGEELEFLDDKHTISYSFQSKGQNMKEIVDRLVTVAEKFIQGFTNDVLYGEEEKQDMWEEEFEYSL
ncbi:hypothetical protein [Bacillus massilinigeriensis]|uniref:hypothetical protein n=1 Tax=Bacillus massilionigeriensis TaxID=1805475 RepID=UPI00096AF9DE|nr:hypothetical protein [Bacillus massilionigeriensis]